MGALAAGRLQRPMSAVRFGGLEPSSLGGRLFGLVVRCGMLGGQRRRRTVEIVRRRRRGATIDQGRVAGVLVDLPASWTARALASTQESMARIVKSACSWTCSKPRTRNGASCHSALPPPFGSKMEPYWNHGRPQERKKPKARDWQGFSAMGDTGLEPVTSALSIRLVG